METIISFDVLATFATFFCLGVFIALGKVNPNEEGVVEKKWVLWLRWSTLTSAFLTSPIFFATAILAWIFGKEGDPKEKNWKIALAIVTLLAELIF